MTGVTGVLCYKTGSVTPALALVGGGGVEGGKVSVCPLPLLLLLYSPHPLKYPYTTKPVLSPHIPIQQVHRAFTGYV